MINQNLVNFGARSRWLLLALAISLTASCGGAPAEEDPSTTSSGVAGSSTPATTAATTTTTRPADTPESSTTTANTGLTVASLTALINDAWPGSLAATNWGDSVFECEPAAGSDTGMGTVLTCRPTPAVEDGQHPVLTALVLTNDGKVAIAESGIMHIALNADSVAGLGSDLFCRDILAGGSPLMQEALGPNLEYFGAVAYWFTEGMPARMDADGNGIPCETLVSPEAVEAVWQGGWIEG